MSKELLAAVIDGPGMCPFCNGDEVSFDPVVTDATGASQFGSCDECKRCWTEIYTLTDAEEFDQDMGTEKKTGELA